MTRFWLFTGGLVAAIVMLAACTTSSQVTLPPATNVYYATFNSTTLGPELGGVAYPLANGASPFVTVNGSVANQLDGASSLHFDSLGRLWTISDNPTPPTIQIFTLPLTASSTPAINMTMTGDNNVFNFVFDASGNLWVTDRGNTAVYEYTGPFASGPISPALTLTSNLSSPWGLAFDGSGNLYVANSTSVGVNSITFFSPPITNGKASSGFLQGITNPTGLVFDAGGNLYVGTQSPSVVRFNSNHLTNGSTPDITDSTSILAGTRVYQLQFDAAGNLYVPACGSASARLYEFPTAAQPFSTTLAPSVTYTDANIASAGCVSGVAFR